MGLDPSVQAFKKYLPITGQAHPDLLWNIRSEAFHRSHHSVGTKTKNAHTTFAVHENIHPVPVILSHLSVIDYIRLPVWIYALNILLKYGVDVFDDVSSYVILFSTLRQWRPCIPNLWLGVGSYRRHQCHPELCRGCTACSFWILLPAHLDSSRACKPMEPAAILLAQTAVQANILEL